VTAKQLVAVHDAAARRPFDRRAWPATLIALAAGAITLAGLFRTEIAAALTVWRESTAFGHCFLVGPIAAWLAWERRDALSRLTPRPVPALAALALPLAAAWFVAERLGIMEGRQFAALFLGWLLVLCLLGLAVGRAVAVPLGYTIFLVPFGAFLVPALQDFTARFVDVGLTLLDVPHVVTATLIEIPEGNFRVAEACAGLRFLIAAIAFGALYACVIYRDAWRRAAFVAVCVVVPVLANGLRALGIVLLGHIEGSAEAGAVDHLLYGWIFFSLVILLLLLLGMPFRQDIGLPAKPAAIVAAPIPRRSALAFAAIAVVALAATGPVLASWLDMRAQADASEDADRAARLAAGLVIPPGCMPESKAPGRRGISCDGVRLDVQVRVFSGRSGPAVLRAWREAADPGGADDPVTTWRETPGTRWRVVTTREPEGTRAAALWLDGVPAPDGMALRLRLARDTLGPAAPSVVLAEIAASSAGPTAAAAVARLIEAQAGFPGRGP
jgi:exosortase A